MIRRPPRSTLSSSSAASDVYKRQVSTQSTGVGLLPSMAFVATALRAAGKRRLTSRGGMGASIDLSIMQMHPRRGLKFFTRRRLQAAEKDANQQKNDPHRQAYFMREANNAGNSSEVVRRFESQRFASNEECVKEYIKALVNTNRLGGKDLTSVLATGQPNVASGALAAGSVGGVAGGTNPNEPLYVVMANPSFKTQLWKTVRWVAIGFMVITGIGSLLEDRGLGAKNKSNNEVNGQLSGKSFTDVHGMDEAKQELEELVAFLKDPASFTRLGGKMPKGLLLTGQPGTGKTLLARAVAGEAGVPFFSACGSEFEEMYVGVGARRVRDLFAAAQAKAPALIFIDEIDAIGSARNPKDQQYAKMTLNQLLVELDGFNQVEGVMVIAATNFPKLLDPALVRPGRFDRHVHVAVPDIQGRSQILEFYLDKVKCAEEVNVNQIARGTPGFTGAELSNLVNLAAVRAASQGDEAVTTAQLEYAKDKIMMGAERKSAKMTDKVRELTAYHEGGHALVAYFTKGAHPIHKATIMPRGQALGMVHQLPETDVVSVSAEEMRAELDVCMGGRAAEELIFGADKVTSGASSDLERATDVARRMVTLYGLSDKIGPVVFSRDDKETCLLYTSPSPRDS
eukprot:TRINITY_DN3951_c0_g1_i4.p1 TRINITY_DN3951_c0_g1~~TRINITY_DN3951_c0_g1_i4.p1  ORF type:complete len:626 (+),score=158.62 TRINITY_DN3951_c0_g1_i4:114-1991(+)